jgi:hypothetical protein
MKYLTVLYIIITLIIFGCDDSNKVKTSTKVIHSTDLKIGNIQACLDTVYHDEIEHTAPGEDWPFGNDTLLLIKRNNDTAGLEKLKIGRYKMVLANLPKGFNFNYYNPDKEHKLFVDIAYTPKTQNEADITIIL